MWNKSNLSNRELYDHVFCEFVEWFKSEQKIDPESDKKNSFILNMGMFNIASIKTKSGIDYLDQMFGPKHNTAAALRLRDFNAHIIAKFGKADIDRLVRNTLDGMCYAHVIPKQLINAVHHRHGSFWCIEMLHKCFEVVRDTI